MGQGVYMFQERKNLSRNFLTINLPLKVFQTSGAEPILAEVAFNNGKADMDIFWTSRELGQQGKNGSAAIEKCEEKAEKAMVCDTDVTKARGVKQCDVIDWSLYYWNVGSLTL